MHRVFLVAILGVLFSLAVHASQLNYRVNELSQFNVRADIETVGTTESQKSSASLSKVEGVMLTKCLEIRKDSYLFVTNMFNVRVGVDFTKGQDSISMQPINAGSTPLGEDMYFEQGFNGRILKVWYHTSDSPYFVNIKLSGINALQTDLNAPSRVLENDLIGIHYSDIEIKGQEIQRNFKAADVQKFADESIRPGDVQLSATMSTNVANNQIHSAQVNHLVTMIKQADPKSFSALSRSDNEDTRGFSVYMQSSGKLTLTSEQTTLGDLLKTKSAVISTQYTSEGNLFDHASYFIHKPLPDMTTPSTQTDSILEGLMSLPNEQVIASRKLAIQVASQIRSSPKLFSILTPWIEKFETLDIVHRDRILYILASIDNQEAQDVAISQLLTRDPVHVLFLLAQFTEPSQELVNSVWQLYMSSQHDQQIRDTALLTYGIIVEKLNDPQELQSVHQELLQTLEQHLHSDDAAHIVSLLSALKNAGRAPTGPLVQELLTHPNEQVQLYTRSLLKDLIKEDPDYPYNKSYKYNVTVGADVINAEFDAELFVGTNFDCQHEYFNYKALAEADANAHIFGDKKTIFIARALYAKKNGQQVGNQILLQVFDKVYYNRQLPTVDCSEHQVPIHTTQRGIRLSKTVWVSIIPVTFSVEADAILELKYGWQICDDKLSAMVEFIPDATLLISGKAEVNLLIIRAGVELDVQFNAALVPQARIEGTQCKVALDLDLRTKPMSAQFETYYQVKKCKFLIFDCKTEKKKVQVWWSWSRPSEERIIWKKEFPIQKE